MKKILLTCAAVLATVGFASCDGKKNTAELEGLCDFSYMVGFRVQLPAPSISPEIGEDLDYTVVVTKPSGANQPLLKTENGYQFIADIAGEYTLVYTVVNAENEIFTKSIVMTATADTQAPVLGEISGNLTGLSIGDSFTVPTITATDDTTVAPYNGALEYRVTLKTPDGATCAVYPEDSFALTQYGNYSLAYTAMDKAGNVSGEKTVNFQVAANGDAAYTVEYYLENPDGTFTLDTNASGSLTGMVGSIVQAEKLKFDNHVYDAGNANGILSGTVNKDGSTVLKAYYTLKTYTVRFDADGGDALENQFVKHGCTLTAPTAPTKAGETFELWAKNDVPFDFSKPIEQDITLKAVYAEKNRYGVLLGNGDGTGWGHDPANGYACASSIAFTQFENSDVMALTLKDSDRTKKSATYLTIDRTGNVAESVRVASYKKYIGFKVYSPVQGAQIAVLIHNGSAVVSKYYFVHKGWNEIVVDVQKFIEGSKVVLDENTPVYRLGIGAFGNEKLFNEATTGSATTATNEEFTFYFDDVYATNYDMKNIVDFDSIGDVNRYIHGTSSIYAVLRTQFVNYGNMLLERVETMDGESALKLTKNTKGQVHGSVAFKADGFFPKDLTGYTSIEVRVKSNFEQAKIWASLGGVLADKTTQIYDGIENAGEWVVYTFDLTSIEDITNVGDLQFRIEDGAVNDTSSEISFLIDYIKFIK